MFKVIKSTTKRPTTIQIVVESKAKDITREYHIFKWFGVR